MKVFLYILFFYSGALKSFFIFHDINFPIDLTLLTGVLLLLQLIADFATNAFKIEFNIKHLAVLSSLIIFYLWLLISLTYTPSYSYSYVKTIYFLTNILIFIYPLLVRDFNVKQFIKISIVFALIFAIWYFWVDLNSYKYAYKSVKYTIYSSFYLSISMLLGLNAVIMLTKKELIFKYKIYDFIVAMLLFSLMLLVRGRAPLIFSIFVSLLYFASKIFTQRRISRIIKLSSLLRLSALFFSLIVGAALILIIFNDEIINLFEKSFRRMALLLNGMDNQNYGDSVETRISQIHSSISFIFKDITSFIFGYGVGSFGILTEGIDKRAYPHNIILEILFELGVIGLILFFIFIVLILFFSKSNSQFISYFTILYLMLNILKSGSLVDLRQIMAILSVFLITKYNHEKSLSFNISTPSD